MGRVIAVINQKGGVGKTTTAINLAASLAVADQKTLIVDLDPQGNSSSALGIEKISYQDKNIYHSLIGAVPLQDIILPTEIDCMFIAPSNQNLTGAEVELVTELARERKLKNALEPIIGQFDYIFIDCPPSLGLLTVNALTAANGFLVPLQCEYFALEGLSQLLHTVELIRKNLNPELKNDGIVLTMYDSRNNLSQEVAKEVQTHFRSDVFETVIPRSVRLSECTSFGKPILLYDINSKGSTAYLNLAKELLERASQKNEQNNASDFVEVGVELARRAASERSHERSL